MCSLLLDAPALHDHDVVGRAHRAQPEQALTLLTLDRRSCHTCTRMVFKLTCTHMHSLAVSVLVHAGPCQVHACKPGVTYAFISAHDHNNPKLHHGAKLTQPCERACARRRARRIVQSYYKPCRRHLCAITSTRGHIEPPSHHDGEPKQAVQAPPVRDDEHGAAGRAHRAVQRVLHRRLALGVQRARCLIRQQPLGSSHRGLFCCADCTQHS